MRAPRARGTAIDMERMRQWMGDFSGYRIPVSEERIDRWLAQFAGKDRDLAARVLDAVDFVTHAQIVAAFRNILASLDGWHIDPAQRQGKWRFAPFSGSSGESGDTMIWYFRHANNMTGRPYKDLFIYRRDLLSENLEPSDTVVFVDDFSGTGQQASGAWKEQLEELLPNSPRAYLVLVVGSITARNRISAETGLTVVNSIELTDRDNLFSEACTYFTREEKETLLKYCRRADRREPKGFGNCGYVVVLAHKCPNNSVPVLHARNGRWEGLFRRYD